MMIHLHWEDYTIAATQVGWNEERGRSKATGGEVKEEEEKDELLGQTILNGWSGTQGPSGFPQL